jgi:saccharopine dehydrogenase-like NADP-dependent oxidoreductase
MAVAAARVLAAAESVDELILADRDEPRAAAIAAQLGSTTRAIGLDISDAHALRAALEDVDIVLNTAGPFYKLGRPVLEASIAVGANYLDICDDWEPTIEMLDLDGDAREAGITAVIGMGASPGTSNLLAVMAMRACDTVERVYTAWRAGAGVPRPTPEDPEPEAGAAIEHWVHNCSDKIQIWRDGAWVEAYGLEEMTLAYPGRGEESVWLCGHPEPITIPRVYPELRESLNVMTSRRGLMEAIGRIAGRVRSGELDVPTASKKLLVEPNMWGSAAGRAPSFPDLFAVAEGIKDGTRIRAAARATSIPAGDMGEYTGIPLATATLMMIRGEIDEPGVHGPEGAVDPDTYFHDLTALSGGPADVDGVVEVVTEEVGVA